MLKVSESVSSSDNNLMDGDMPIDVFVLGGIAQSKVGSSYNSKKRR